MALKVSKVTLVVLAVAILGFVAFFLFLGTSVPGEKEILARIAVLEKQPLPTSCPDPFAREGLLVEVSRMAIVYKVNKQYKKAEPFFLRDIELLKKLCGTDYSGLIGPMLLLAENYELDGRPEKAEPLHKEIRIRREKLQKQDQEQRGT